MADPKKPVHVLLVDDNHGDTMLVQEVAKSSAPQIQLTIAHGGEDALKVLENGRKEYWEPDLILLDLNMPGRDGFSVLAEIRAKEHMKYLPVIVFTSSKADIDVKMAYELKANAYLTKPVELDDLGRMLAAIQMFWGHNVTPPHGPDRTLLPSV